MKNIFFSILHGMSFPSKEDRLNCWGSRDEYWKCLDTKSETECTELRKQYEKFCSPQWVNVIFVNKIIFIYKTLIIIFLFLLGKTFR